MSEYVIQDRSRAGLLTADMLVTAIRAINPVTGSVAYGKNTGVAISNLRRLDVGDTGAYREKQTEDHEAAKDLPF